MTTIVVQVQTQQKPLPPGVLFAATAIVVVDNSGATLDAQMVNGTETPPWSATFTGVEGPNEAVATLQALDTAGNNIGEAVVVTETGTGGQPGTFPAPTGATITVS
jgi:hypothetical protein